MGDFVIRRTAQKLPNPVFTNNNTNNERDITTNRPFPEEPPMLTHNPLYQQFIMKPPKENVTHGRIPDIEFISSADRNYKLYPTPAEYVIPLKDEYKNVISVSLFNGCIPNTAFLVSSRNNLLYIQESSCETIIVEIPVGDYTPATLTTALSTALNTTADLDSTYTVTLNSLTNKYEFASNLAGGDHMFNFIFCGDNTKNQVPVYNNRSMGQVVGFSKKAYNTATGTATITAGSKNIVGYNSLFLTEFAAGDYVYLAESSLVTTVTSVTSNTLMAVAANVTTSASGISIYMGTHRAPNKYNLSGDNLIVLNIRELQNVHGNATAIDEAFAVVPMAADHNSNVYLTSSLGGPPPYKKFFNPPLPRLDRLTVRFTDYNNNLIDFNGIDNFMEFRIMTMNQPGKYDPEPNL